MSYFIVEEISAANGLFPVVVRLSGRDLPVGGRGTGGAFTVGPGTRQSEYWYPQVDEPTRHILGSKYEPINIKGLLQDRYSAPGHALAIERAFEKLATRPVRISWGPWSFRGLLDVAKFNVETEADIAYDITFHIDGPDDRGRTQPAAPSPTTPSDLRETATAARTLIAQKSDELPALLDDAAASVVYEVLLALLVAADALIAVAEVADDSRAVGAQDLGRILSLSDTLSYAAARARYTTAAVSAPDETHDADRAVGWQAARAELVEACADLEAEALATSVRLEHLAAGGQAQQVYTARDGDTLESVARERLGDEGRAADIARLNALANFRLAPGQRLVLPA